MNLLLTLESIKFYKVKHERLVQIGFVLLFLLNLMPYLLPFGNPYYPEFERSMSAFMANPADPASVLTGGNIAVIMMTAASSLVNLLFTFAYATLMVGESDARTNREIFKGFLVGLPRLILLGILMIVPVILSAFLVMIPVVIAVSNLYLLPLMLLADRKKLTVAIQDSMAGTKGFRMMILLQMFFLSALLYLPESIILGFVPASYMASVFIAQFFAVLQTFAQGRLMGTFYLYLVKKVPVMIPSKPQL